MHICRHIHIYIDIYNIQLLCAVSICSALFIIYDSTYMCTHAACPRDSSYSGCYCSDFYLVNEARCFEISTPANILKFTCDLLSSAQTPPLAVAKQR